MSEMTTVQDTEQQAETAEAGDAVDTSTKAAGIERSFTKYDPNPDGLTRVYESSTHQFLIYFRHDKSLNGLLAGFGVWLVQFGLYITMLIEAFEAIQAGDTQPKNVHVQRYFCEGGQDEKASPSELAANLTCETETPGDSAFGSLTVACCLITSFLLYDIVAFVKVMRGVSGLWAKMAGIFVFSLTVFAFFTAIAFAFVGIDNGSTYDALVNCVGVLFIHDIDEKIYEAWSAIDKKEEVWLKTLCCCRNNKCCKRNLRLALTFLTFVCAIVSGFLMLGIIGAFYQSAGEEEWNPADNYWYGSDYLYYDDSNGGDSNGADSNGADLNGALTPGPTTSYDPYN